MIVRHGAAAFVCVMGSTFATATWAAPPVEFTTEGKAFVEVETPQGSVVGIGKYEVTVSDYVEFLNAVAKTDSHNLWTNKTQFIARVGSPGTYAYASQPFMGSRPISNINWFDAARYVNWMHNGRGTGSTETGVYALNGGESLITERSNDARFWIPSDDEWREAAYGKGDRNPANYWLYATQSDALPTEITVDPVGNGSALGSDNSANYNGDNTPDDLANIGTTGRPSYYGAYDMAGNIAEIVDYPTPASSWGWDFGFFTRGGDWVNNGLSMAGTERGGYRVGVGGLYSVGLRLATVPEPASLGVAGMALGLIGVLVLRRQRRR